MAKLTEKVYGEALFELAVEEGRTDSLLEEVRLVSQVLSDNPDLAKLMQHPGIPESDKEKLLKEIWDGKVSKELTGLMLLLLQKEHYSELPLVLDYFTAQVKEKEKIGIAYIKTAVELNAAQKGLVEKRLLETTDYRSFELHFEVDTSLIGGMIIRIGDRVVDSSIKTKLENLSRQLYQIKLQ